MPLRTLCHLIIAVLSGLPVHARAQEAAPATDTVQEQAPATVRVTAARKLGEVNYRFAYPLQQKLRSYQPPPPRLLEVWYRGIFPGMSEPERDAYVTEGWTVSVLSESVDVAIPTRRGGYFQLPDLPAAYEEHGVVLFREPNRRRSIEVEFVLPVDPARPMRYASLGQAVAEMRTVQSNIPFYSLSLRLIKHAHYDGIKACFLDSGGAIRVNGQPLADATVGNCKVLKIDPARAKSDDPVEFAGPLDIVTMVTMRDYPPPK